MSNICAEECGVLQNSSAAHLTIEAGGSAEAKSTGGARATQTQVGHMVFLLSCTGFVDMSLCSVSTPVKPSSICTESDDTRIKHTCLIVLTCLLKQNCSEMFCCTHRSLIHPRQHMPHSQHTSAQNRFVHWMSWSVQMASNEYHCWWSGHSINCLVHPSYPLERLWQIILKPTWGCGRLWWELSWSTSPEMCCWSRQNEAQGNFYCFFVQTMNSVWGVTVWGDWASTWVYQHLRSSPTSPTTLATSMRQGTVSSYPSGRLWQMILRPTWGCGRLWWELSWKMWPGMCCESHRFSTTSDSEMERVQQGWSVSCWTVFLFCLCMTLTCLWWCNDTSLLWVCHQAKFMDNVVFCNLICHLQIKYSHLTSCYWPISCDL